MNTLLMVVRAFPPFAPVGHTIRAVKFIKYLPSFGWRPVVLTIDDHAEYETMRKVGSTSLLAECSPGVKIYRTKAGEPTLSYLEREQAFGSRNTVTRVMAKAWGGSRRWAYRNLAVPDRHVTWLPYAVNAGCKIVEQENIDVLFATCPPHSSVLIGAVLKKLTGLPLVLDYRDDWLDTPWYQAKSEQRRALERRLERWAVNTADRVILVTEYSWNAFLQRYASEPHDKFAYLPNGVDLAELTVLANAPAPKCSNRFTIVHAGSLNESASWGRDVSGLFQALQNLLGRQPDLSDKLRLVFAGDLPPGHVQLAERLGLLNVIEAVGHLPHAEVLRLMQSADLLLAINYEGWSTIVPAKIYEYWAVGKAPILLLSCRGAAAGLIQQHSLGLTVEPGDVSGIEQAIVSVYHQYEAGTPLCIDSAGVDAFDRRTLTCRLAESLAFAEKAKTGKSVRDRA